MRAAAIPTHEFPRRATNVLRGDDRDPTSVPLLQALTRHYTRVVVRALSPSVLRLSRSIAHRCRLLAWKQVRIKLQASAQIASALKARSRNSGQLRAPSIRSSVNGKQVAGSTRSLAVDRSGIDFKSPLYRTGHALLVRVFVPSPEGAWLSDESVVSCENGSSFDPVRAATSETDAAHAFALHQSSRWLACSSS